MTDMGDEVKSQFFLHFHSGIHKTHLLYRGSQRGKEVRLPRDACQRKCHEETTVGGKKDYSVTKHTLRIREEVRQVFMKGMYGEQNRRQRGERKEWGV